MNKDNINTVAHRYLNSYLTKDHVAVDATCGNGNDTLFLAKRCKKVIGFDIQKQAIENTEQRCKDYRNIELHLLSHALMDQVVKEPVDCIVFNFGYLPKADPSIITQPDTSLKAVQTAWNLLKPDGLLVLCCYVGHPGGQEETNVLLKWIEQQDLNVVMSYRQDRPASPILKIIKK